MNKMWSICTLEYYSALKRNEILTLATMWMNLGNMMLSEINQMQKDKYCLIARTRGPRESDPQRQEVDGGGQGLGRQCFMGTEFQFGKMRKFWRCLVGMVAQQCECA